MVPCPWFKEFATYAHQHPQYDYGIHLTLNSEWDVYRWGPVASPSLVPSLLDGEGYLWDNVSQVAKHAKAEEVRTELKAQIDRAKAFGVPLSHLDTHMGAIVSRPDLVDVYIDLALEYHLPILFMRQMDDSMKREYPALASRLEIGVAKLGAKKLPMLDTLLQFYGGDQPSKRLAEYERALNNLPAGVTQLIIHCGIDNEELRGISDSSPRRDQDRRIFTDPATKRLIQANGIKLLSWKELGEWSTRIHSFLRIGCEKQKLEVARMGVTVP